MKKFFAMALIVGAAGAAGAREPMLAPPSADELVSQVAQTTPQPIPDPVNATNNGYLPGVPGQTAAPVVNHPLAYGGNHVVPGTLPGQPVVVGSQVVTAQPGVIVCDTAVGVGLPLYRKVKVRQARNIAPCAVEKIVSVPDPCDPCQCVLISICVPPCACEEVICSPRKDSIRFDYGKYAVNVRARNGMLIVNYDD